MATAARGLCVSTVSFVSCESCNLAGSIDRFGCPLPTVLTVLPCGSAHPDDSVAGAALAIEGDVDTQGPKGCLCAPKASGKCARCSRPIRASD
jgi:hypothetical protein